MHRISDIFKKIDTQITGETVSIGDLIEAVHERGFGFLILILSAPMALPIPVPPFLNILLASPLILLTAQQAVGKQRIWLPQWMLQKTIKRRRMSAMIKAILPWAIKIETFIKPRLVFVTSGIFTHIIGIFGLIMALAICVPIPMTNTVPSLGIALMAIGIIAHDGLAILAGAIIGVLWVIFLSTVIIFLGTEGIEIVKATLQSYL